LRISVTECVDASNVRRLRASPSVLIGSLTVGVPVDPPTVTHRTARRGGRAGSGKPWKRNKDESSARSQPACAAMAPTPTAEAAASRRARNRSTRDTNRQNDEKTANKWNQ
jgi:hypothetical protein